MSFQLPEAKTMVQPFLKKEFRQGWVTSNATLQEDNSPKGSKGVSENGSKPRARQTCSNSSFVHVTEVEVTVLEVDSLGMDALEMEALEVEALETEALETEALETEALETEALEAAEVEAEVEALGEVSLWCCLVLGFKRRILSSNFLHFFPSCLNKNNMFCVKECYWKYFTSQYF